MKLVEPIGPKFCVEPHMTLEKVYGTSKFARKFLERLKCADSKRKSAEL